MARSSNRRARGRDQGAHGQGRGACPARGCSQGQARAAPFSHAMSDDFIAGLFARLELSSASEAADKFNTDTILGDLVSLVLDNPNPDAAEMESIRLYRYPELTAYISVYREESELWLQFRIGYLNGQEQAADRKNFNDFISRQQHNPFRTAGGRLVNFTDFFVNEVEDAHHRFGADFLLHDLGVNAAADLLDYLLVRCIY